MSRLTEKREKPLTTKWEDVPTSYYKIKGDDTGVAISEIGRLNKLGKLEDLEEEIGCPLEVVIRAVRDGIYIENVFGKMVNFKCYLYYKNQELGWYFIIVNNGFVPLTDYKIKFWLKEDKSE